MTYAAIADWAAEKQYSVTFMCDQLGVVRQGYYRWRFQGPCAPVRVSAPTPSSPNKSSPSTPSQTASRRAPDLGRAAHPRGAGRTQTGLAADARCWPARTPPAIQGHRERGRKPPSQLSGLSMRRI